MTMFSMVSGDRIDGYAQLVRELQAEFECADVDALAERIVESEAADFYWESRIGERYLGQHVDADFNSDDLAEELVRVACLSRFACRWHVGTFLINGEGQPSEMLWKRSFDDGEEAEITFLSAR